MNIIFIAPPAAGKGTQSKMLSEEFNIPHISTGDLLRDEIELKTELGNYIKSEIDQGNFVKDEVITELLTNRLTKPDCDFGYILDGYPRNIAQAEIYEDILDKLNKDLGVVIFLNIDKKLALQRIKGRIVCKKCGMSYNLDNKELLPKVDSICDKCGNVLEKRNDDNESTFENRFDTYLEKTSALIDYYDNKKVLKRVLISESDSALDTYNNIKKILGR